MSMSEYARFGRQFEEDLAEEFNLEKVPGSGNQWHSKLDLTKGRIARWSLKCRFASSFFFSKSIMNEAIEATEGLGGSGEIPIWAFRLVPLNQDFIVLRKEDFKLMQEGEISFIGEERSGTAKRKHLASTPVLLREDDD